MGKESKGVMGNRDRMRIGKSHVLGVCSYPVKGTDVRTNT